jgi:SAM-dependent methyltransferase
MELSEQYRLLHEAGHFPGFSIRKHVTSIDGLIRKTGSKTILDYGCGKGRQYAELNLHKYWNVEPTLYDPATFPEKPEGRFDGVVCTDVLEHIPEEDLREVLREIFNYSRKFVFLSICTREARKTLPDGRNAHLTIKPEEWWLSLMEGLEPSVLYEVEFND